MKTSVQLKRSSSSIYLPGQLSARSRPLVIAPEPSGTFDTSTQHDRAFQLGHSFEQAEFTPESLQPTTSGQPLPQPLREKMESAFSTDFSNVRVHEDGNAAKIGALAYTKGTHLHFAPGQFRPHSSEGQKLIGHELTHVMQQRSGQVNAAQDTPISINEEPGLEAEADRSGAGAAQGKSVGLSNKVTPARSESHAPQTNVGVVQPARQKPVGPGGRYIARQVFGQPANRQRVYAANPTRTPGLTGASDPNSPLQQINPIQINSTDNNVLTGRHYIAAQPQGAQLPGTGKTVLFLSGSNGSSETYSEPIATEYARMGANVFAANYRGFGRSSNTNPNATHEKEPSEKGLYEDAQAMYNHMIAPTNMVNGVNTGGLGLNPADIIVHGYSLGGPIAANLVKEISKTNPQQLGGLVLHSPMPSASEAANASIPGAGLPTKALLGSFDLRSKLRKTASRDAALPVHFMSGSSGSGDQLSLQNYPVYQRAGRSLLGQHPFTNVSHDITPNANHTDTAAHMTNPGTAAALQNILQNGRARVPGAPAIIQPQNNVVPVNNGGNPVPVVAPVPAQIVANNPPANNGNVVPPIAQPVVLPQQNAVPLNNGSNVVPPVVPPNSNSAPVNVQGGTVQGHNAIPLTRRQLGYRDDPDNQKAIDDFISNFGKRRIRKN